jgi:hypothetical protein
MENEPEVLGRSNRLLSLIRHGPHWKRRVQQFFYCCMRIRYLGNVSNEPLHSDGFLLSRFLATIRGMQTHIQQRDLISLLLFFQNKESRLKIGGGGPRHIDSKIIS